MKIEHIALYVNDLNAARDFFIRYLEQMGYAHIAFSLGSKEKVDALTKRLKTDGYEIVSGPRTTGDGYYESCIIDVENNRIELTV